MVLASLLGAIRVELLEAFDAPDVVPIAADQLAAVDPEQWYKLRLALTPSLRLLEASAPVDDVWKAATEGQTIPSIHASPTAFRIWRDALRVFHRRLEPLEIAALRAVANGRPFADVCDMAATIVGKQRAPVDVVRVLRRWFDDGMIVRIELS